MIIRARSVVTMDGPPIENGAVVVSGDRIVDVGRFDEVRRRHHESVDDSPPGSSPSRAARLRRPAPAGSVVDVGEQVLLPGLINAHCHLDYTCLRAKIPRRKSFTDWIRAINAAKAKLSPADYLRSIEEGFAEAKRFGTTTIANLTAFPELVAQISEPIRTWWFAELIDVRDPSRANETVNLAVKQLKESAKYWGLAPHAPFTASVNLYRCCEEVARRESALLTTHLAESRDEMSMFREGRGPMFAFLKGLGRDMKDCGKRTPLEHFRAIEVNRPYLVVHLNELGENDFIFLRTWADNSSIVHCPRSHDYFGHSPFQFQKLRELGFNICLGTDSLASNDDLSLFAEMRAFHKKFPDVPPDEILKMVTVNAARALQQENALGKIRSGFVADLIAVPCEGSTSVSETTIGFENSVSWAMTGGEVQKAA